MWSKFDNANPATHMFCREYCEIFKNIYFEEHVRTAASEKIKSQQIKACVPKNRQKYNRQKNNCTNVLNVTYLKCCND